MGVLRVGSVGFSDVVNPTGAIRCYSMSYIIVKPTVMCGALSWFSDVVNPTGAIRCYSICSIYILVKPTVMCGAVSCTESHQTVRRPAP